jgi:hypothetical protein
MTNPDTNLGPFLDSNLIGCVETICKRIDTLIGIALTKFLVFCATPGTPRSVRQSMMKRFAEDIRPPWHGACLRAMNGF